MLEISCTGSNDIWGNWSGFSLQQLSERWPYHIWFVGRMKFALEANWVGLGPFSLKDSSFLSLSLGEVLI